MVEVKTRGVQIIEEDKTNISNDFYNKNKDIYNLVNEVLEQKLIARNNDLWLIFLCWLKQRKAKLIEFNGKKGIFIEKENLPDLELPSSITRERRTIQIKN